MTNVIVVCVGLPLVAAIADALAILVVVLGANDRRVARPFAAMAGCMGLWNAALAIELMPGSAMTYVTVVRLFSLGFICLPAVVLHNAHVWSGGDDRRIQVLVVVGYGLAIVFCILGWHGFVFEGFATHSWGEMGRPGPLYPLYLAFMGVWVGLSVMLSIRALKSGLNSMVHLRMKYWLLAAAFVVPLGLTNVPAGYDAPIIPLAGAGDIIMVGIIAYAAVRHRLMDIDLFVMRVAATLMAGVVVVLPIAGVMIWAQHLPVGVSGGLVVGSLFLAAIVCLFVFSRFRSYLEEELESSLLRRRQAARDAIRRLSADLVKLPDFHRMGPRIASTLVGGLRVHGMALYLSTERGRVFKLACAHGEIEAPEHVPAQSTPPARASDPEKAAPYEARARELGWEVCVPVRNGRADLGWIALAPKRSGGAFDDADLVLLQMFAAQLAIAVKNAEYVEQIENQRAEIQKLQRRIEAENVVLRTEVRTASQFKEIIGSSPALQQVLANIERIAPTKTSIIITGETGTGKELIARAIHELSPRRNGPLICVNCAAIPPALAESELFGHERGAFTDALQARPGKFELAHGGTIFLDEIAELAPDLQVKLLRVLQEHETQRVGSSTVRKLDLRVLAATNRNLQDEMRAGRFREDLYFRLATFVVDVPPLRERTSDIPMLATCFLGRAAAVHQKHMKGFSPDALDTLSRYNWPGNIRELQNVVERAVLLCASDTITSAHLSDLAVNGAPRSFGTTIREEKKRRIQHALVQTNNNQAAAARLLGISPNNLARLMKSLGLKSPRAVH